MKFRWLLALTLLIMSATYVAALELKEITFDTKSAGKVTFSHKIHLKKKTPNSPNIGCKSCHNENMKLNTRYTMADMEKGKSCGMCHGKTAFALSNCTNCHKVKDIAFRTKEAGTVTFSHNKHLKSMQCNSCHTKIFNAGPNKPATMADMEKGKSCGACHNGKKAFSIGKCGSCHATKEVVFKVSGLSDVKFSHDFHTKKYKCGDCHNRIFRPTKGSKAVPMEEMEKGKSCGACHDGKTAFTVRENCDSCHHK